MSKLVIRGTKIDDAKFYAASTGGGAFTLEIKFRAAWSKPVCDQMGWNSQPDGFGNGKLEGKLTGISLSLEPNATNLKDYALDITIGQVDSFRHIAKTEDGEVTTREIEFVATASGENALKALHYIATYVEHCGPVGDRGQCKITYNAEEQMEIEEAPPIVADEKPRGRKKEAVQ